MGLLNRVVDDYPVESSEQTEVCRGACRSLKGLDAETRKTVIEHVPPIRHARMNAIVVQIRAPGSGCLDASAGDAIDLELCG